jgi:parvulin-like peptidyl-prolyl isomerase
MGNRVLNGAPFEEVAKQFSEDLKANNGGNYDWVEPGNLVSKQLDQAIFNLPVNRMSPVITDDKGVHIIRVVERTVAGKQAFVKVQNDIKDQLRIIRRNKAVQEYIAKVKLQVPVWNSLAE